VVALAIVVLIIVGRAYAAPATHPAHTKAIIRHVFGGYGDEAVRVASCETGGTFSVWAKNGQYLGLFQMGSWERRTFGHGRNAWAQSRAARRYFIASGRDWSPWSCKP
jgi:hypothetical protein